MYNLEAACSKTQVINEGSKKLNSNSKLHKQATTTAAGTGCYGPNRHDLTEVVTKKSRVFNIHQRLKELYLEECRNTQPLLPTQLRNIKRGSRLLEKLVERETLNTLIVNLYPGNKGYSLSLRLQGKVPSVLRNQAGWSQGSEVVNETMKWPYSDEELLNCIDNEEIPANLVDLLEANHSELFYQGCVIAEIRDYRLTFPLTSFEPHYVLLRPTTQSIINDVNIISSSQDLSSEDRLSLESQVVLATAPPLCLEPNPAVGVLLNNLQNKKHRLNIGPLRRAARKFSQVTVNRKRKLDQFASHSTLHLYDVITRHRAEKSNIKTRDLTLPAPPPVPKEDCVPVPQAPLEEPEVMLHARHYEKPSEELSDTVCHLPGCVIRSSMSDNAAHLSDCKDRHRCDCCERFASSAVHLCNCSAVDYSAHLIEEYVLETGRGQGRIYHIKLTILQRYSNSEYLGELYVDRDYKEGETNGASCRFVLGTRAHANRYIQQFTEIFTEDGRKSVRITHVKPYSQCVKERAIVSQQQQQQILAQTKAIVNNNTQSNTTHVQHILPNTLQQQQQQQGAAAAIKLQKLQTNNNNANTNNQQQPIQINSVLQLTSLLANSVPPNVNIHQIQQGHQGVIGITGLNNQNLQSYITNVVSADVSNHTTLHHPVNQQQLSTIATATVNTSTCTSSSGDDLTIRSLLKSTTPLAVNNIQQQQQQKQGGRKATLTHLVNPRLLNHNLIVNNTNQGQLIGTTQTFPVQTGSQTYAIATPQQAFTITATKGFPTQQTFTVLQNEQQKTTPASVVTSQAFTIAHCNNNTYNNNLQHQTFQFNSSGISKKTFTINQTNNQNLLVSSGPAAATAVHRRLSNCSTTVQTSELNKLLSDSDTKSDSNKSVSIGLLGELLAGTPSADNNSLLGATSVDSTLLESLASSSFTSPTSASSSPLPNITSPKQFHNANSIDASPPCGGTTPVTITRQGLQGLQGLAALQNVQVSIPTITVPLPLSLNVPGQHGSAQGVTLMTSLPVSTTTSTTTTTCVSTAMVLTSSATGTGNLVSLPVAQIMASSVKGTNHRITTPGSISIAQGAAQPLQLVSALQRPTNRVVNQSNKTLQGVSASSRHVLNTAAAAAAVHRQNIKVTPAGNNNNNNSVTSQFGTTTLSSNQVLTLTAQQQFQLALQNQSQRQSLKQCLNQNPMRSTSPPAVASKHRRRSNTAETNK